MSTTTKTGWEVLKASVSSRNGDLYVEGINHETTSELDRKFFWHINNVRPQSENGRFDFSRCVFADDNARRVYQRLVEAGMTLAEKLDAAKAKAEQGPWTPASGGTEVPFTTRSGRRLLYVFQATTGRHAYLDCQTDLILSDDEAQLALGK